MRLSALDASNFYYSQAGRYFGGGDMISVMVLDSGHESPSIEALREALATRIALIPALRERIALVPGDVAYPHWVTDPTPPGTKFAEMAGTSWDEVVEVIQAMPLDPLDPLESAWRGHIWRNVEGAPGIANRATVIAMKVSHAVTDGRGVTQIQRALFGDDAALTRIPGHGNAGRTVGFVQVLTELAQAPWNLVKFIRAARQAGGTPVNTHDFQSVAALNSAGERFAFLDVRHVAVEDLRWGGSVTETGLAATSIALEAYLEKVGGQTPPLFVQMPVVPPGLGEAELPVPSGNSASVGVVVDLSVGTPDRIERAGRIRQNLAGRVAAQANDDHLAGRKVFERVPVQILRLIVARGSQIKQVPWHIGFTSYTKGRANLQLLGHPLAYFVGPPILRPGQGLGQTLLGLGDRVTVSVGASDTIPQPELYADLLHAAMRREI